MTRQQSFKRRVRGRMARTGESYTSARRQLLARARARSEPPVSDLEMVHAVPTAGAPDSQWEARRRTFLETRRRRLEQVTDRSMGEWVSILDKAGAREMTHREAGGSVSRWQSDWLASVPHTIDRRSDRLQGRSRSLRPPLLTELPE